MKKKCLSETISLLVRLCRRFNLVYSVDKDDAIYWDAIIDGVCLVFDCACVDYSFYRCGSFGTFKSVVVNGVTYDID